MPRKANQLVENDDFTVGTINGMEDEDFTVGTIAGLDADDVELMQDIENLNTEESVEGMTTITVENNVNEVVTNEGVTFVTLYTKSEALANLLATKHEGVTISNDGNTFAVTGKYLRVTRSMAENALGREINDTQWRMLFLKRDGFNISLNDHEFTMGEPSVDDTTDRRETIQTNIRMDIGLRDEMNKYRDLLGLSQNDYVVYAIKELNAKMEAELESLL